FSERLQHNQRRDVDFRAPPDLSRNRSRKEIRSEDGFSKRSLGGERNQGRTSKSQTWSCFSCGWKRGVPVWRSMQHQPRVTPDGVNWEEIPQSGEVPSAREGHTLCVIKGKLYLFGGASSPDASECLPGVYSFDVVSLTWQCLSASGVAPRVLRHSSAAAGDNIYVYGGVLKGDPTDDLLVFNTVSLTWTPVKTSGSRPPALWGQSFTQAGDQIFMFGGYGAGGDFCKDLYVLNTEKLQWQRWEVKGESPAACSGQTLTAHHDKVHTHT
ncbi:hypothetical protein ILYODFUR_032253, partial [Ilyodon furcidens]